jgi:parallel beta-helix repeat protein
MMSGIGIIFPTDVNSSESQSDYLLYTARDPIYIYGTQFTVANGVTSGSGTQNDPYIIEGWDINASSANGIEIRNTEAYFIIRNCYVHDGGVYYDGIYFNLISNGRVENTISSNNFWGINMYYSIYNNIFDNNVSNNRAYGIHLECSWYNNISNNTASNNKYVGISLSDYSMNNNIYDNIFSNNKYGIYLSYSSDSNWIYHNNLTGNMEQAYDECTNYWDDGYPSGGNYWSDYTGVDEKSGQNQNQPGSDGIGDTPYNISGDMNKDLYPLMSPWAPPKGPEISVKKEFIPSEIMPISEGVVSVINTTNIDDIDITSMTITDEYVNNMAPNGSQELLVTITSDEDEVYAVMPEDLNITSTDRNITISFELPLEVVPVFWENNTLQFGSETYYIESILKDWVVGIQYLLHPVTELEIGTYCVNVAVTAYSEAGESTTETATGMLTVSEPIETAHQIKI